jgi:hypothetical protein
VIESHSEQTLKFSQKDGANIKVKNFKIIPEICRQQGRSITVNKTRETIHISRCNTVAKDSPCGKVSKPFLFSLMLYFALKSSYSILPLANHDCL